MALDLPFVHVRIGDGRPRVETISRPPPLDPGDLGHLLALDRETRPQQPPGDRVLPLEAGSFAVGRGGFGGVTWRIVPAGQVGSLAHPAWLWRSSRWFDPGAPTRGPTPEPVPLRDQLDPAARLCGGNQKTVTSLASVVAAVRRRDKPVAIVVDPHNLADPAPSARWFMLALLTILPDDLARTLRLSTFEEAPSPDEWDVVVANHAAEGFTHLYPSERPSLGGDIPATFVWQALTDGEADTVEMASRWLIEGAQDPWSAGIRKNRTVRGATPQAPNRSARPGRDDQPRRLRLNTPEAWLSLSNRNAEERARIIGAWLDRDSSPPSEEILGAVAVIRPVGQHSDAWCRRLLEWAEDAPCAVAATQLLTQTLDAEPLPLEPSTRASLYTEAVRLQIMHGLFDEAAASISGPCSQSLLRAGAGRVVADAWVHLPVSRRPVASLDKLIERLLRAESGDDAVAFLWLALIIADQDTRADHVLQHVARLASADEGLGIGALLANLADSPQAMRWVGHVARSAPPERLWSLVAPVTTGPDDPLWEHCVDVRSHSAAPEDRIADLVGLPAPQVARNERELRQVAASVRVWRFPDAAVAEGAARLSDLPDRAAVWPWLHLCASDPALDAAGTRNVIIEHLGAYPPNNQNERQSAMAMSEGLGAAPGWGPGEHSAVLSMLLSAPDGDGSGFTVEVGRAMARGMSRRPDSGSHLASITSEICGLTTNHQIIDLFLNRVLPMAFAKGVPEAYVSAVDAGGWSATTRSTWARIVDSLGPATTPVLPPPR